MPGLPPGVHRFKSGPCKMKEFIIAGDIGRKRDNFALLILKDVPRIIDGNRALQNPDRIVHHYEIVHGEQAKGLRYEQMVDRFVTLAGHRELTHNYDLLVDGSGVGDPVVEMIRKRGLYPVPIIFTGGDQVHEIRNEIGNVFGNRVGTLAPLQTIQEIRVPKADMKDAGALLLQQDRIHCAQGLPIETELEKQLMGFKGKVNEKTGRAKYEAEAEDIHDDLVVCYLMFAWWALRGRKDGEIKERLLPRDFKVESLSYEPFDYM